MISNIKPIPDGYHTITPYIIVKDAVKAIEFYKNAFGATENFRMESPDGKIGHCELQIGDSKFLLADEFPEVGATAPSGGRGRSSSLIVYVNNVDEVFNRAVSFDAKVLKPLKNEFYGDRMGSLQDPFGHNWTFGSHVEDVSPEEIRIRAKKIWNEIKEISD